MSAHTYTAVIADRIPCAAHFSFNSLVDSALIQSGTWGEEEEKEEREEGDRKRGTIIPITVITDGHCHRHNPRNQNRLLGSLANGVAQRKESPSRTRTATGFAFPPFRGGVCLRTRAGDFLPLPLVACNRQSKAGLAGR